VLADFLKTGPDPAALERIRTQVRAGEIYARDDYYFGYHDPVMKSLIWGLDRLPEQADRDEVLRAAQERIAARHVGAFLFQLPKTGVADARIEGLWVNAPTQATDMTAVHWRE